MDKADNRTNKRKIGDVGENIACEFLTKRGFTIVERNYLKKWGEIDIIATKGNTYRFIEVKTLTDVPHVTNAYRPEENVHPGKLKRMYRTIQIYLLEKEIDSDFQIDVISVNLDNKTRRARVEIIENIIG